MVHLLLLRSCKNYVYGRNASYGTHQIIEREISKTKYKVHGVREGYNIPFATEWHLVEYRVKKEIVPKFIRDLHAVNLNPEINDISLWQVITGKVSKNKKNSIGRLFLIIQWLFKWINRKKVTCFILTFLGIMLIQFWLLILAIIIYFNPIKPVPNSVGGKSKHDLRKGNWSYDFVIGTLNDCGEPMKDFFSDEKYYQEDIL